LLMRLEPRFNRPHHRQKPQGVKSPGTEEKDMGPYYPRGRYMTTNQFETAVPCQIEKR
jgi:hypothetical protein